MGVHGLWRLIEPSGKPVPLETLENKVLAVDVSIWLHQAVKGFQDSRGAPVPNAHLLGIYHRICKLLYFKVKPVFVFDGGVPALKRKTIAKRNKSKNENQSEADQIQKTLLSTLLKHTALNKVLSEKTKTAISEALPVQKPKKNEKDTLFYLSPIESDLTHPLSEDDESDEEEAHPLSKKDLYSIDTNSAEFKALPIEVRHEILTDLKDTRKQSSWGRLHELPTESNDFSSFQMKRLLKRQSVQQALDDIGKEISGNSLSLGDLEYLLKHEGVITGDKIGSRIASDENKRYLLIKDVKQALEEAKKKDEKLAAIIEEDEEEVQEIHEKDQKEKVENKADLEFDEDLKRAIALSLQDCPSTSLSSQPSTSSLSQPTTSSSSQPSTSKGILGSSFLENFNDADFESDSSEEEEIDSRAQFNSARSYMMEYSGFTPSEVARILDSKREKGKNKIGIDGGIETAEDFINKQPQKKGPPSKIKSLKGLSLSQKLSKSETRNEQVDEKCVEDINYTREENLNRKISHSPNLSEEESSSGTKKGIQEKIEENIVEVLKEPTINGKLHSKQVNCEEREKMLQRRNEGQREKDVEISENIENSRTSLETNKRAEKEATVELMSDSDNTDDNDDFMEVSDKEEKASGLEIVVNPNEDLDDDLFNDIFEDDTTKTSSLQNENGPTIDAERSKNKDEGNTEKEITKQISNKPIDSPHILHKNSDDIVEVSKDAEKDKIVVNPKNSSKSKDVENEGDKSKRIVQKPILSIEEMKEMKRNLDIEEKRLISEKSSKERLASNITDQMYQEAQELLELFGIPYLIAPMEAEAQCAFLNEIGLTDGTITDDSDIWLFGGRTVYKNFFNHQKHVLEFKAEDIKHHFRLTREQMILLALLVGSDYTTGLSGVGPVTALEILAAFPPVKTTEIELTQQQLLSGLAEFRAWFSGKRPTGPRRLSLRSKLKNVSFHEGFPNPQVVQAYLSPTVDTNRDTFTWGKPNIQSLIEFGRIKFGWTKLKSEEILKPVLKRLEDKKTQSVIKDYFKTVNSVRADLDEGKLSDRVKKALKRIGGEEIEEEEDVEPKKKRVRKNGKESNEESKSKTKPKKTNSDDKINGEEENSQRIALSENDLFEKDGKNKKRSNKNKSIGEAGTRKASDQEVVVESNKKKSNEKLKRQPRKPTRKTSKVHKTTQSIYDELDDELENAALLQLSEDLERKEQNSNEAKQTDDPEMKVLIETARRSKRRVKEIEEDTNKKLEEAIKKIPERLHRKEPILQKQKEKADMLRNKLKAIEVFRKSKQGPGYVKKRNVLKKAPKEDAELSENSDDE